MFNIPNEKSQLFNFPLGTQPLQHNTGYLECIGKMKSESLSKVTLALRFIQGTQVLRDCLRWHLFAWEEYLMFTKQSSFEMGSLSRRGQVVCDQVCLLRLSFLHVKKQPQSNLSEQSFPETTEPRSSTDITCKSLCWGQPQSIRSWCPKATWWNPIFMLPPELQ